MEQLKGIGDSVPDGWVLEEFKAPLPKGLNNVIDAIRQILKLGKIRSLLVEIGKPITYTRFIRETEKSAKQEDFQGGVSPGDIARNIMMEEYSGNKTSNPLEIFFDILLGLSVRHLYLTHIGIGTESRFFQWMKLDTIVYGGIEHLAGGKLVRDEEIPNDIIIFYGNPKQGGRLDQATYALKCYMFLLEDIEKY